ncbi:hypothetical protein [Nostoc sp. CHAB 5715]|uniref:hypothetical protein n=1 Tax=Nostoc sp. CHAB 5715 TaxID=2780400 RepID=UPI001E33E9D7|nr:hypothetical protein [Nostoc sp. CHAB 5715]
MKYESGCRDVAVLHLYRDFGIMQNHFHTWNQQRRLFKQASKIMQTYLCDRYSLSYVAIGFILSGF